MKVTLLSTDSSDWKVMLFVAQQYEKDHLLTNETGQRNLIIYDDGHKKYYAYHSKSSIFVKRSKP